MRLCGAWLVAAVVHLIVSSAGAVELGLPLACEPGRDCWVPRYVDTDPGPAIVDFRCGDLSGDAHDGTDFAIPDLAALRAGVPVLAAAPGTVAGTRDGMEDVDVQTIDRNTIKGRECGNGVVVRHADGWETQYCHLRRGSVAVGRNEHVETGTVLGMVGMSGDASFPHVHFTARRDAEPVDPFTGFTQGEGRLRPRRYAALGVRRRRAADIRAGDADEGRRGDGQTGLGRGAGRGLRRAPPGACGTAHHRLGRGLRPQGAATSSGSRSPTARVPRCSPKRPTKPAIKPGSFATWVRGCRTGG